MSEPQTAARPPEPDDNGTGEHAGVPAFFAPPEEPEPAPVLSAMDLHSASVAELAKMARELQIPQANLMRKRGLILNILATQTDSIRTAGIADLMPDGFGFLRGPEASYLPGPDDVYMAPSLVRHYDVRPGDSVQGITRPPRNGERYFTLAEVESINLVAPGDVRRKSFYEELTPLHPDERFILEHEAGDVSTRILDMLAPLGKGQRALIVSPPRAGKTVLLQSIAHAITANHPDTILLVLLIDERPEEVTEMTRSVRGEVLASTFDEPATRHVQVAEAVARKARRLAEQGKDVVILLDSITRLARAYNTTCPPSGKILSGGVDANALQKPKRFFGAARNLEEGGSLTILATALIDTGSRMDDVIFEEFKGTGNAEIVLERKLADRRIWPAIDINRSGTRKEDLLLPKDMLQRVWTLRKVLQPLDPAEGIQLLTRRLAQIPTNAEFLLSMKVAGE